MPTEFSIEPPYDILMDIIKDVGFEVMVKYYLILFFNVGVVLSVKTLRSKFSVCVYDISC